MFIVHVEDVHLSFAPLQVPAPLLQQPAHQRRSKRIEHENYTRPSGEFESDCVSAYDSNRCTRQSRRLPVRNIFPRNAGKARIQLHPNNRSKRELGGKKKRASHTGAYVDECEFVDRAGWLRSPPSRDHLVED